MKKKGTGNGPRDLSFKFGLALGVLTFFVFAGPIVYQILKSTRSTAIPGGIAIIFLDVVPVAAAAFFGGWAAVYLYQWNLSKVKTEPGLLAIAVLSLFLVTAGLSRKGYYYYLCGVAKKTASRETLLEISQSSFAEIRSDLCLSIYRNPIVDIPLALEMRTVSGCSFDDFLASSPDTPAEILVEISREEKYCDSIVIRRLLENKALPAKAKEHIGGKCPDKVR